MNRFLWCLSQLDTQPKDALTPEQRVSLQRQQTFQAWQAKKERQWMIDEAANEVLKRLTVILDKTAIEELKQAIDSLDK